MPSAGRKLALNHSLNRNTVTPAASAMALSITSDRRRKIEEFMVSA